MAELDVRETLPDITVPTLVMHRSGDTAWDVRHSRYLAEQHPGRPLRRARRRRLASRSSATATRSSRRSRSSSRAGRRGGERDARAAHRDVHRHRRRHRPRGARRRRALARPARTARRARPRASSRRFGGREVKTVGDGFLAMFDGPPSRALRCAQAITRRGARARHRGARRHAHGRVRADRR